MDLFWRLAEEDVSVRQQAVLDLIQQVQAHHSAGTSKSKTAAPTVTIKPDTTAADLAATELPSREVAVDYVLRRLIRGLASDRLAARQGFATALTQLLLTMSKEIPTDFVLTVARSRMEHVNEMGPSEKRDYMVGEVFFLLVLARSGRITEVPIQILASIVVAFGKLGGNARMKTMCTEALVVILPTLTREQLVRAFLPVAVEALPADSKDLTADDVILCLALRRAADEHGLFSAATVAQLIKSDAATIATLPAYVRAIAKSAHFPRLVPALNTTIKAFPIALHSVWDVLIADLLARGDVDVTDAAVRAAPASNSTSLALFVRSVIVDGFIEGHVGKRRGIALSVTARLIRAVVAKASEALDAAGVTDTAGVASWLAATVAAVMPPPVVACLFETMRTLNAARSNARMEKRKNAQRAEAQQRKERALAAAQAAKEGKPLPKDDKKKPAAGNNKKGGAKTAAGDDDEEEQIEDATGAYEASALVEEAMIDACDAAPALSATLIRLLTDPAAGGNRLWDSRCGCGTVSSLKAALSAEAAGELFAQLVRTFSDAEQSARAEVRAAAVAALEYEQYAAENAARAREPANAAKAKADAAEDDDEAATPGAGAVALAKRAAAKAKAIADLMGDGGDGDDGASGSIRRLAGSIGDLDAFLQSPAAVRAVADVADATRQWALDTVLEVVRARGKHRRGEAASTTADKARAALHLLFRAGFFTAPEAAAAAEAEAAPEQQGKRSKSAKSSAAGAVASRAAEFLTANAIPALSEKVRRMCVVRFISVLQELLQQTDAEAQQKKRRTAVRARKAAKKAAGDDADDSADDEDEDEDEDAEEDDDADDDDENEEASGLGAAVWCGDVLAYWQDLEAHGYTLTEELSEGALMARAAAAEAMTALRKCIASTAAAVAAASTKGVAGSDAEQAARRALIARARGLLLLTAHCAALQLTEVEDFSPVLLDLSQAVKRALAGSKDKTAAKAAKAKKATAAAKGKKGKKAADSDSEDDDEDEDDEDDDEQDNAWIEVVVEIILSLLVKPSALLRVLSTKVFTALSGDLTAGALADMLAVVAGTKDLGDDGDDEGENIVNGAPVEDDSEFDEDEFEVELTDDEDEDDESESESESEAPAAKGGKGTAAAAAAAKGGKKGGKMAIVEDSDDSGSEDDAAIEAAAKAAIAKRKAAKAATSGSASSVAVVDRRKKWDAFSGAADGESDSSDSDDDEELDFGKALRENPGTESEVGVRMLGGDDEDEDDDDDEHIDMATLTEILAMDAYTSSGDGVKTRADVALQQLVAMKRARTRTQRDLRHEAMNFRLRVLDLIEIVIRRHANRVAELMLYEPLLVALASCTLADLKTLHDRLFALFRNKLCRPYQGPALPAAPSPASAAAEVQAADAMAPLTALALKEVLEERFATVTNKEVNPTVEALALNVMAIIRVATQYFSVAASEDEWAAAKAATATAAAPSAKPSKKSAAASVASEADLQTAVKAARVAFVADQVAPLLTAFLGAKRSRYNHRFFEDLMAKLPLVAWRLLPPLTAALDSAPTVFNRSEALELIAVVLRGKNALAPADALAALRQLRPHVEGAEAKGSALASELTAATPAAEPAVAVIVGGKGAKAVAAARASALDGAKGSSKMQKEFVKTAQRVVNQFHNALGAVEEAMGLPLSVVRKRDAKKERQQAKFEAKIAARKAAAAAAANGEPAPAAAKAEKAEKPAKKEVEEAKEVAPAKKEAKAEKPAAEKKADKADKKAKKAMKDE